MHWIDQLHYIGLDRRERRLGLRLVERRREKCVSEPPPPLSAAIRHLRARVPEADHASGRQALCRRAKAVALLANAYENRAAGDVLMNLVRKLEALNGTNPDPRPKIYAELDRLDALLLRASEAQGQ